MKKKLILMIILLPLAGGVGWSIWPKPLNVECATPERRKVQEYISEEAKTHLADEYIIDVPVSAGNVGYLPSSVKEITLEIGDIVQKGDVVARVDDTDLRKEIEGLDAQIAQNKARITGVEVSKPKPEDLESAEVLIQENDDALKIAQREAEIAQIEFEEAQRVYNRIQGLLDEGVTSQAEFDAAKQRFSRARQNVERTKLAIDAARKTLSRANLASQRVLGSVDDNEYMREVYLAEISRLESQRERLTQDLKETVIHAPVTGPILEKYVDNPRVLSPGSPILKIGDTDSIEIECDVLSEEIVQVREGATVEITGKALQGDTLLGTVKRIYPAAFMKISSLGIEQQRVKVLIDFDNSTAQLRAGTRVDLHIITGEAPNALAIPERAIFREEGEWHIFTVDNGYARLTPVEIGLRNDTWVEISSGIDEDTLFIVEPGNDLKDGASVKPMT